MDVAQSAPRPGPEVTDNSRPPPLTASEKNPRSGGRGVRRSGPAAGSARKNYLAKTIFEILALAREAAFLCTTPDFTALSIAEA